MAVAPITVYDRSECAGHIITVFVDLTSTGLGVAETITITAGLPVLDLTKAHPILSILLFPTQNSTMTTDVTELANMTGEVKRGTAPDSTGEFDIESSTTIKFWTTGDANGTCMITYWAAGCKAV